MSIRKKSLGTLIGLFGFLCLLVCMHLVLPDNSVFSAVSVSTCYLLLGSVAFYFYISRVTVRGAIRRNLLCCGVLILLFFVLRGARYIAFVELDQVMRHLWYLYYIPLLFLPFFSFLAALSIGKPDDCKVPRPIWLLFLISAILSVLIMTNDVHQWVFRFAPGFREHWVDEYTYGPLYYAVYAWTALVLLGSLGIMFLKCRVAACRKQIWVPLIPSFFGLVWLSLIALDKLPSVNGHLLIEFPEAFCFTVAAAWLCCIQIGLVPANASYAALFDQSSVRARISDRNGKVLYSGTRESTFKDTRNIRIQSRQIHGGTVSWETDVTELNRINEELASLHQQLEEEAELIRLEHELKKKQLMLEAKNALYDTIAKKVLPQSEKISRLAAALPSDPLQKKQVLQMICFYGCYLKRMSNLMLIAAQQDTIGEMELALAAGESLNQLRRFDILTSMYAPESDRSYTSASVAAAYELFEQYVERTLPRLKGIQVTLKPGVLRLTLECTDTQEMSALGNSLLEQEDETYYVTLPLEKGGCGA